MPTVTTALIGLRELGLEPCDGTGDDVMSTRFRNKWHIGIQPARPRRRLLNPAVLAKIASRAARERLSNTEQSGDVVALWTVNRQFHQAVVRQWEACSLVDICCDKIVLAGPHMASRLELDRPLFAALWEHEPRGFSDVVLSQSAYIDPEPIVVLYNLHMTCIERLDVSELYSIRMKELAMEQLAHIIDQNKDSLKVLKMSTSLLSVLPPELKLTKFMAPYFDDDANKFQGPWMLDTKVYKGRGGRTPPEFLRHVNADEVHLDVGIWSNERHPLAAEPSNSRMKKLVLTNNRQHEGDFHFDRIVRDVAVMCSALEYLEVVYLHHFRRNGNDDPDYLSAMFEHAVKECGSHTFRICLNAFFNYYVGTKSDVIDFARDEVKGVDLPPICRPRGKQPHYHLVKETVFGTKSLRMNFKVSVNDERWSWDWSTNPFPYKW